MLRNSKIPSVFWGYGVFFALGILEFPAMSSPSLTGGSLYGILDFYFIYSRNSRFGLGILEVPAMSSPSPFGGSLYGILEFSVMRSPDQVGGMT